MEIKYHQKHLSLNLVIVQYYTLLMAGLVWLQFTMHTTAGAVGIFIAICIAEFIYRRFQRRLNQILQWKPQKVKVDTVMMMGKESLEKGAMIDYVEFNGNEGEKIRAFNLERLFLPFIKPSKSTAELKVMDYLSVYINPANPQEVYFNTKIQYHHNQLKKLKNFISIIFLLFFIYSLS